MTQKGKDKVTAPQSLMERQGRAKKNKSGVNVRELVRELAQQEALERLIALLDTNDTNVDQAQHGPMPIFRWDDSLHRLARLRMARATYALETTGEMVRVGPGAWVRRRA